MNKDKLDLILVWIGNIILWLTISFAVFILGYSGWWFLFIAICNFKTYKRVQLEKKRFDIK